MKDSLYPDNEFEMLYTAHHATVYRVCLLYLKNRVDAEDITQSVFLNLIRHGMVFASDEHAKAWLIRVASNACKNVLRSWWRNTVAMDESLPVPEPTPQDETIVKVLALPDKYKLPLYLHYYEGYTAAEIGQMLGGREATVRSWLLRGRQMLKLEIEKEEAEHETG